MPSQSLIDYFNSMMPLSVNEKKVIEGFFKPQIVKKRDFLLRAGEVCQQNTFITKGCFRMYMIDAAGKEHNLQFGTENWWIGDIGSFHSEKPSQLHIRALEDSIILQINKEDQLKLFVDYPKFNRIFRVLSENAMISQQRRILQNISSTAEERYLDFLQRYPHFFNRISNVQIASFLGVTPEFLSTIRKRLSQ